MQTNFSETQLKDKTISHQKKYLKNVFIVECVMQLVQLMGF